MNKNPLSDVLPNGSPLFKYIVYGIGAFILLCALLGSTYVVEQGRYGIVQRFGQIVTVTKPGLHFKIPFVDSVDEMPSSLQTLQVNATSVSKDIQEVNTKVNVQYSIPEIVAREIYANYRTDTDLINKAVVAPGTETITKAVTAKFTAEQLISQRDQVAMELKQKLAAHLKANAGLVLAKIDITDFGFSQSFTTAIENKVVAEQAVLTEKQNLEQKKVEVQRIVADAEAEAQATRLRADAEAYAIRKQNENANELTVKLRLAEAELNKAEAMKKWTPNVIGGSPLVNVKE